MKIFSDLARYYDAMYYKPEVYEAESELVSELIQKYKHTPNTKLLDVACGTGTHIRFFMDKYQVSGLDISDDMLALAREQYQTVDFHNLSMIDFDLAERFGAIICLYGSIGFVQTLENLNKTLRAFSNHLEPGGVLILTPWSSKETFSERVVYDLNKSGDIKVARMEQVEKVGEDEVGISQHYLIADGTDVNYYKTDVSLRLFSFDEYERAIRQADLDIMEFCREKEIQMGMAYVCRKKAIDRDRMLSP
jgi:ubiquinone/menaquinone biosynthesis C-methylase UbiE